MAARRGRKYATGELEIILSLAPTERNLMFLSELLQRTPKAIELVYRIAFGHGPFARDAEIQESKVLAAKKRVGIAIGRKQVRSPR
jgi:hypothetical protein